MRKILITGIAGLLGSNLSRYLLDKGFLVYGIDDLSGGYIENIDCRIIDKGHFFNLNIIDNFKLSNFFENNKIDIVFHFAAYAAEGLSPFIRNYNYMNNVIGSVNIINNCINHSVEKLIFTSSMAVYGEGKPPFTETDICKPIDPYGIAKYTVEQDIVQANNQFGLKYNILRPHNIIGKYQNIWDKYRNVIGIWIRQILNHEKITIFGDGQQSRAFSDVNLYLEPLVKLININENEVFNLGSDNAITINEAANTLLKVAKEFGYEGGIKYCENRHEVKHAFCEHQKAREKLNFQGQTDLEGIIKEMFQWAIQQPDRISRLMPYEVQKGLYSFWI
ncbi:MAG: NAD-dependent epimerase/dehydratase family protein [Fermentimonas sp.]|nr:NAD-dependent epimerase/dehydratase family protein [Fermentimonas sp.]